MYRFPKQICQPSKNSRLTTRAWSCVVVRGRACSCVVVRGRACSCVVVRGRARSFVVMRGHAWSVVRGRAWTCVVNDCSRAVQFLSIPPSDASLFL